jgi:hypothetical protein
MRDAIYPSGGHGTTVSVEVAGILRRCQGSLSGHPSGGLPRLIWSPSGPPTYLRLLERPQQVRGVKHGACRGAGVGAAMGGRSAPTRALSRFRGYRYAGVLRTLLVLA